MKASTQNANQFAMRRLSKKSQSISNEIYAKGKRKSVSNRTHVKASAKETLKTSGKANENLIIYEFA